MPRIRDAIDNPKELEENLVENHKGDLLTVYSFGIAFLEFLDEVQRASGNYHTVGADKFHSKFLCTSNSNGEKFRAGGTSARGLLMELMDEYNWHENSLLEELRSSVAAFTDKKVLRPIK